MRVLCALDKFKGTIDARGAGHAVASVLAPQHECTIVPLSDGGEGFQSAFLAGAPESFFPVTLTVCGPVPQTTVEATYLSNPRTATAIVESSAACGLFLVPQSQRDPLHTTAYGVGQLLRAAFEAGHTTVVLGLGGSATNEAGLSVLQGLGCDLVLANGRSSSAEEAFSGAWLEEVVEVRAPESDPIVHQMLSTMRLDLACDVDNPFLGSRGAVETFSAQKGSTPQSRRQLERGMEHVSGVLEAKTGRVVGSLRGAGAAGGMCGGLAAMFTHARIMSGVRVVAEHLGLEKMVRGADVVVTGEGAFDAQSLQGKVVGHVVGLCHQVGVPVYVLCGRVDRASIMSHQLENHEVRMDAQWLATHVAALVDYVPLDMALHDTSGALQITTRQFLLPIFSHQLPSSIRPPS